jgi:hypothetical protein
MKPSCLRRLFAWCVVCALFTASASADVYFPVLVEAAEGTLPPLGILVRMCAAKEVLTAAAADAELQVIESRNELVRLRADDGQEFWVRLNLSFPEGVQRNDEPSTYWGFIKVDALSTTGESLTVEQSESAQPFVERLANAWAPRVETALSEFAAEPVKRRRQRSELSLDLNFRHTIETKSRIGETQKQLQSLPSTSTLPVAVIEKQLSDALTQQQILEVELAGLEARKIALEERIANFAKEVDEKLHSNTEIADNLSKQLQLLAKEEELLRKKIDAGEAKQSELDPLRFQITLTMNDLNNARRAINGNDVEPLLSKLRSDLADAIVQMTECNAKNGFIEKYVEERSMALQVEMQQVQPLRNTLAVLQRQLDALEAERFELSRNAILAEAESRPVRVRKLVPAPAEIEKPATSP